MLKALVIYHSEMADMKLLAEKVKQRLEDLGMQVTISKDKQFKDSGSIREYDIIALGSPCLACTKCHGAEECPAPKKLRRHMKKLFTMDLKGKKLITFANSTDSEKHGFIRRRIETLMEPTKIKPVASIGYTSKPSENLDAAMKAAIQEQAVK